jgi:hypothetical protein
MKTLLVTFSLVILASLTHISVLAQAPCPYDAGCPWTTPSTQFELDKPMEFCYKNPDNGVECCGFLYYCYRTCGGYTEFFLRAVYWPDKTCLMGFNMSDSKFHDFLMSKLIELNPTGVTNTTIPPCNSLNNSYYPYYRIYKGSCYEVVVTTFAATLKVCNTAYECFTTYGACWDTSENPAILRTVRIGNSNGYTHCPNTSVVIFTGVAEPCTTLCTQ